MLRAKIHAPAVNVTLAFPGISRSTCPRWISRDRDLKISATPNSPPADLINFSSGGYKYEPRQGRCIDGVEGLFKVI